MVIYEPDDDFRRALTHLDLGEAELIVTPAAEVAEWAEQHGYRIVRESQDGTSIFEIWSGRSRQPFVGG